MTRLVIVLSALLLIFAGLSAWLIFKSNPWKARATTAEAQSTLNAEGGAIADKAGEKTTRILIQSETLGHEVETAPGGDAPIPDAVRDGWSAAIGGLRDRAAGGDADRAGEPAGGVPGTADGGG